METHTNRGGDPFLPQVGKLQVLQAAIWGAAKQRVQLPAGELPAGDPGRPGTFAD